jgi:hypothetical protein
MHVKCPKCALLNPPEALRCDCGWDFASNTMKQSYLENIAPRVGDAERTRSEARWAAWRGIWFVFCIVIAPLVIAAGISVGSYALGMGNLAGLGLAAAFFWGSITVPFSIVAPPVFGPLGEVLAPILQWGIVGAAVGRRMNGKRARRTALAALAAVVGTGISVLILLRELGYRFRLEGP